MALVILHIACTSETERAPGLQPWYSLMTLKTSVTISNEYQGYHPDGPFRLYVRFCDSGGLCPVSYVRSIKN